MYLELIIELRHNEESSPSPQLLGLEHISKDVVADIQYISEETKLSSAKKDALFCKTMMPHLPLAPISLERTSELPPLYTAESSKVPLWDPMLSRPVSLFT